MVFKKILKSYGKSQLENIIYCSRGFHCRAFNFLPCAECFHFFPDFFSTAYAAFHGWQLNFSFRAEFINHIQQQPAARPSPNHPKTPTHFSSFIGLKRCLKLSVFWLSTSDRVACNHCRMTWKRRMANHWSGQKRHRILGDKAGVECLRLPSFAFRTPWSIITLASLCSGGMGCLSASSKPAQCLLCTSDD